MSSLSAELRLQLPLTLGEGPVWDARDRSLVFVDLVAGHIYRWPIEGVPERFEFGQPIGAALPADDGGLVIAAQDGIYVAGADASGPRLIAPIEADMPENRMNDANVDPAGRLWAGTMAFEATAGAAALYCIAGTTVRTVLTGVTISNGIDWSPDETLMYYVDSGHQRIDVLDYDRESGEVTDRRPFAVLPDSAVLPDGLTVDAVGGVWVADFGGGVVRRFDPAGRLDRVVEVGVPNVTSCCFGGPGLDELFITTARHGLSAGELAQHPLSGSLFSVRPGVSGRLATRFEVVA